ncbi:MAG: hypothetical protein HC830_05470 [Bacteroidetes bacterium]|nr:hypothetical protein [Bacteroidota bacterium]
MISQDVIIRFSELFQRYEESVKIGRNKPGVLHPGKEHLYNELMQRIELALKVHVIKEMKSKSYQEKLESYDSVFVKGLVSSAKIQSQQAWSLGL